jgi:hypothetical protein
MALWELQAQVQFQDDEVSNCDFCDTKKLDTWYYNEDDNEVMCVPCVWKRNGGE